MQLVRRRRRSIPRTSSSTTRSFTISVSQINERDLESLHVNFLLNDYYPVNFTWRDKALQGVGIRSRGTGSRSGVKPGLRIDFDRWATDQKFLGLKSVILRNQTQDASNLRERLVHAVLPPHGSQGRARGARAAVFQQRATRGSTRSSSRSTRCFSRRTTARTPATCTNSPSTTASDTSRSSSSTWAATPICTCRRRSSRRRKKPIRSRKYIERLIWTIDQAGDAAWRQSIAEYLDLPKFIRHLAIESFLAEEDGITGDYGPNNFYFYRYENKSLFQFIPWDKSNTFWEAPSPNYFILRNVEDGPVDHRNRLVQRALKYPDLWTLFLDTLEECANSASAGATTGANPQPGWLESEIQREYVQIREAALADTQIFTNVQFEQAIADLKVFAAGRSDAVKAQVATYRARGPLP